MFHKNTLVPGDIYCSVKSNSFCCCSIKHGKGITPINVEKCKNSVSQEPVQNEKCEGFTGRHPCGLLRTFYHHEERKGNTEAAPGFSVAKEAAPACSTKHGTDRRLWKKP